MTVIDQLSIRVVLFYQGGFIWAEGLTVIEPQMTNNVQRFQLDSLSIFICHQSIPIKQFSDSLKQSEETVNDVEAQRRESEQLKQVNATT